jgi:putative spermidine/putrescine transport system permease protein
MPRPLSWRPFAGLLVALVVLLPLLPLLVWSFGGRWFFPALWPQAWSLDAWRYVLSPSSQVAEALLTSTLVALATVALCVALGLPAARGLGLHVLRGRSLVEWLILLPLVAPGLVVAMGVQVAFIRYGLADRFVGVVLVHVVPCLPYFVLVMGGVFANYSTDLEETARTLGARPWRVFWHVTLPAIAPGLAVAILLTFIVSWAQYISTVLIGGGQVVTLPMVLFPLVGAANHANAAAVSIVFLLPALLALGVTARALAGDAESGDALAEKSAEAGGRALGGFGKL